MVIPISTGMLISTRRMMYWAMGHSLSFKRASGAPDSIFPCFAGEYRVRP